jgi:hypothetical protein
VAWRSTGQICRLPYIGILSPPQCIEAKAVNEIIDGTALLAAHGTRQMPIWGFDVMVRSRIMAIVDSISDFATVCDFAISQSNVRKPLGSDKPKPWKRDLVLLPVDLISESSFSAAWQVNWISDLRRQASRRARKAQESGVTVVTGVSLCAAAPLELPYATSSGGKPSCLVVKFFIYLVSAGNKTSDSKQQLHFRQYQIWQARLSLQCSDVSGAISSLPHWTHFIPKLERRLDALVLIIASALSRSRSAKT